MGRYFLAFDNKKSDKADKRDRFTKIDLEKVFPNFNGSIKEINEITTNFDGPNSFRNFLRLKGLANANDFEKKIVIAYLGNTNPETGIREYKKIGGFTHTDKIVYKKEKHLLDPIGLSHELYQLEINEEKYYNGDNKEKYQLDILNNIVNELLKKEDDYKSVKPDVYPLMNYCRDIINCGYIDTKYLHKTFDNIPKMLFYKYDNKNKKYNENYRVYHSFLVKYLDLRRYYQNEAEYSFPKDRNQIKLDM